MNRHLHSKRCFLFILSIVLLSATTASAWHDRTHLSVAKVAGYESWYNAAGPDLAKLKAGAIERPNHYVNKPRGTVISRTDVFAQVPQYDNPDSEEGRLYGAIISAIRNYFNTTKQGKYAEYHLAYCAHYAGDLSMPFHNIEYKGYAKTHHQEVDATVESEVFDNCDKIKIYDIEITSEDQLATEIARIANISIKLGYKLVDEERLLTKEEAYTQLGHSASLFKAILKYVGK